MHTKIEYTGPRCRHCGIPTQVEAGGNSFEVRYNETCCLPCAGIKAPQQAKDSDAAAIAVEMEKEMEWYRAILREAREYWGS